MIEEEPPTPDLPLTTIQVQREHIDFLRQQLVGKDNHWRERAVALEGEVGRLRTVNEKLRVWLAKAGAWAQTQANFDDDDIARIMIARIMELAESGDGRQ